MRQGDQTLMDDERTGLKGNGHGTRYQAGITEHLDGAGGRSGYGILSATAGECGCGVSTGY